MVSLRPEPEPEPEPRNQSRTWVPPNSSRLPNQAIPKAGLVDHSAMEISVYRVDVSNFQGTDFARQEK